MSKSVKTRSEDGFVATSNVGGEDIRIDATGEETADTLEHLLAAYAACYVPALRVGAEQRDAGELGRIDLAVSGQLNESDKLDAVEFTIDTEADLGANAATAVIERANELCKVQAALKESLRARVTLDGHTA